MRILLAHNSLYYPSHGGGDKSNRLLMQALAARGHDVRVVARIANFGAGPHARFVSDLHARGVEPEITPEAVRFPLEGVDVHTLTLNPRLRAYFSSQLAAFDPDVILTSTDDPGQLLFDIACRAPRARLVHLVRTTIAVPFGPDSSMPSLAKAAMLRQAGAIVGVSEYVAGYIREWGGLPAIHLPISLMESGEPAQLGRFDHPYVAMVNPCAVKGIVIFLALADRRPRLQFAAVPLWGTNASDLAELRRRPNIHILEPVDNVDELFRRTRVLLVPSVWAEARSRIVVEAMLRGVPVIASDAGGLPEAKLGVPYLLPVNKIAHYQPALDETMVPVADVPAQNLDPWLDALDRLTSDPVHWEEIAMRSRAAALEYARTLSVEPFESFLVELIRRPNKPPLAEPATRLSQDKRRLLALRLEQQAARPRASQQKSAAALWFPALDPSARSELRLFCFPHAGAGSLAYRSWLGAVPGVAVIPVLLPGREARSSEPPFENMEDLIQALALAIEPLVQTPFAFFGHSMGAGIAFELARSLRRLGAPLPGILIVSAARAPQCRIDPALQAEPSDRELLEELHSLGAIPRALLENTSARELALPLLRADSRLYRHYIYRAEPPLPVSICAYGGAADARITAEDLDHWREHTSVSFRRRQFEGGHFYLHTNPRAVLEALRLDLPGLRPRE